CRWSPIFRQTRRVFRILVLPVCIFQAEQERCWALSAGGLRCLSRPPTFLGLQCCRSAIFKQATSVFGLLVPEVCNFQADHQRFWAFSAGSLADEFHGGDLAEECHNGGLAEECHNGDLAE
ncbi:MAG: hypothetical protein J6W59_01715, partial [Bacteroidales bacterium]|nr:hypothetical protein [Bacteroidales bacterium]